MLFVVIVRIIIIVQLIINNVINILFFKGMYVSPHFITIGQCRSDRKQSRQDLERSSSWDSNSGRL